MHLSLDYAVLKNDLDSIKAKTDLLLILASYKEQRTRDRQTPLHLASTIGQLDVVKLVWSFSKNKGQYWIPPMSSC